VVAHRPGPPPPRQGHRLRRRRHRRPCPVRRPDLSKWREDDRGYADVPVSRKPLDDLQIAEQLPTLGIRNGDPRPHMRGKLREYLVL
jgi:hypothetical protein